MDAAGRGFGVSRRSGRGPVRQQPKGSQWIQVGNSKSNIRGTEDFSGPVPGTREVVERQFTTYCALALGHPKGSTPRKVELLRKLLMHIRDADPTAAIPPYMKTDKVNSICHPSHILEKISDFEHYFPEGKYYLRRSRTKCWISTSPPIALIKNYIFNLLKANDFWIESTSISCQEASRCGFFLYTHPDLTYRFDIINTLTPILAAHIQHDIPLEFDVYLE